MTWDDTKIIINSEIGKYITTARLSDGEWYVASACDEEGAMLDVKLDFL